MHITLVQDQLNNHDLSKTIIMSLVPGVTYARVASLLKSDKVILPFWNLDPNPDDYKRSNEVFFLNLYFQFYGLINLSNSCYGINKKFQKASRFRIWIL